MVDPRLIQTRLEEHRDTLQLTEPAERGLSERIARSAQAGGFPLDWVLVAVDDVADEVAVRRLAGEEPTFKEVLGLVIRWTRRPRKPITKEDRMRKPWDPEPQKRRRWSEDEWADSADPSAVGDLLKR